MYLCVIYVCLLKYGTAANVNTRILDLGFSVLLVPPHGASIVG